jgi:hypothetical protein
MARRVIAAIVLLSILVLTGCDTPVNPTGGIDITLDQITTLQAVATLQASLPTLVLIQPTATPEPLEVTKPTSTPSVGSITITSIIESAPGRAIVSWDAVGEFLSGYKVVWTDQQSNPTFPENTSVYTSDPYARSAMISGEVGKIYFVRVCRFINDSCDIYSNLGIFAFINKAPTAVKPADATATMQALIKTPIPGGAVVSTKADYIKILLMKGGDSGKASITWEALGSFPTGFKIVYSKTSTTPTFGYDYHFVIGDGAARSAYVDGDPGTKYYYRICRWMNSKCDLYSPVFTYTFTGTLPAPTADPAVINNIRITDYATGQAQVSWDATGSFPSGFKILFSTTNTLPVISDGYVYVDNGALRTALVDGLPGQAYYFRICKYVGSCVVYSTPPSTSFTFANAPVEAGFTVNATAVAPDTVTINWVLAVDNPGGYKILWSLTSPVPNDAFKWQETDPTIRSHEFLDMTAGTTVYVKACKFNGTYCTAYSDTIAVDVPLVVLP